MGLNSAARPLARRRPLLRTQMASWIKANATAGDLLELRRGDLPLDIPNYTSGAPRTRPRPSRPRQRRVINPQSFGWPQGALPEDARPALGRAGYDVRPDGWHRGARRKLCLGGEVELGDQAVTRGLASPKRQARRWLTKVPGTGAKPAVAGGDSSRMASSPPPRCRPSSPGGRGSCVGLNAPCHRVPRQRPRCCLRRQVGTWTHALRGARGVQAISPGLAARTPLNSFAGGGQPAHSL